jgi:hypothetical protein
MSPLLLPLQLALLIFPGWVNRRQLDVIEYLQEENRVLKERLGGRRIRFTDVERRRLARKAQLLGRKVLKELETLVTPDTLLRWYRELIASKWNYSDRRGSGRPRVVTAIADLIVKMAIENPSWGYTRIRGALDNLGYQVGRGTIANILQRERVGTGSRARQADPMVDVFEGALGVSDRHRFSECRGVYDQRSGHALCSILYQHRIQVRAHRRNHASSGQRLDGAGRS